MQLCCSFTLRHCRVRRIFLTRAVVPLREIGCRGQERGRAVRWHDRSFLPGEGHRRGRAEETEDLGGHLVYDRETPGLGRSSHRAKRGGGRTGRAWPRREAHGDRFRQDSGKDWRKRQVRFASSDAGEMAMEGPNRNGKYRAGNGPGIESHQELLSELA